LRGFHKAVGNNEKEKYHFPGGEALFVRFFLTNAISCTVVVHIVYIVSSVVCK